MDLDSLIRSRRSVRAFRSDPVPDTLVTDLVELANWAPSAGNLQARDFVVVRDVKTKRAIGRIAGQNELAQAAVVVVVCANASRIGKYGDRGRDLFMIQDAAAATENLLLAAHDRGLGAVWMGSFDEEEIRSLLDIPNHARPVTLVGLGWPDENPPPPERLPLKELLHLERW